MGDTLVTYTGPSSSSDLTTELQIETESGERHLLQLNGSVKLSAEDAEYVAEQAKASGQKVQIGDSDESKLTGKELDARVAELGIEGASNMTADQKREAVAEAEADADGEAPVVSGDTGVGPPTGDNA